MMIAYPRCVVNTKCLTLMPKVKPISYLLIWAYLSPFLRLPFTGKTLSFLVAAPKKDLMVNYTLHFHWMIKKWPALLPKTLVNAHMAYLKAVKRLLAKR